MNIRNTRGFTLPEVLVTLAIVATLAAVLMPALNNQLSKGDSGRVSSDLVAVQTAVGAFASDVRRYPSTLLQLKSTPTGNDILAASFGSLAAKWRGPYLSKDLGTGNAMPTGYGATISAAFDSTTYNGIPYLTIHITGLTTAEFENIDQILDEKANSEAGQFQLSGTTAVFAAVPIQ
ncbi:MAG: prepilin-type N-terminal cleavage/methylation domain-containing protein [Gemmatimonadaceae bacterium]|nr:prepilin-type N-terminal cleavage/methylation domain-containing protein [Gemmatimonadaceae bacterium]